MVFFEDYKGGGQIGWTTVPRFKGLESEVVIVCRVNEDERELLKKQYIAYSRAKILLHILKQ